MESACCFTQPRLEYCITVTANGGTAASAFAALCAGIDGGMAYFNIHTNAFAGGEIRQEEECRESGTVLRVSVSTVWGGEAGVGAGAGHICGAAASISRVLVAG